MAVSWPSFVCAHIPVLLWSPICGARYLRIRGTHRPILGRGDAQKPHPGAGSSAHPRRTRPASAIVARRTRLPWRRRDPLRLAEPNRV